MLFKVHAHCHTCGNPCDPAEATPIGPHLRQCARCQQWHQRALAAFCGQAPPPGCQRCEKTLAQLKAEAAPAEPRMYIVGPVDGLYVILCAGCNRYFEERSRHRYRDTPHGKARNLN